MGDNTNYPRGSEWKKWDLHLHTPSSYDYRNKSITDEDIIKKLHDSGISVVAITDHHIIDIGRVWNLYELGKRKGIKVFVGIEFLSDTRGKEPIHFIGIFDFENKEQLQFIWEQLKNRTNISKVYRDKVKQNEIYCDLEATVKIIKELNGIVTVHAGQKHSSIESITNALPHTMAQKRDIAEIVDIFELGKKEDEEGYIKNVFPHIGYKPMILCSDNHDINNYVLKTPCWIKADPTFEGLKQIIYEPKERVFIGEEPELLQRARENKTKFIKTLAITQVSGYDEKQGIWFKDIEIPFNHGLVAIIGNKGSGKSAIVDILGLCGNSHQYEDFSFLKKGRFLAKGLAENFEVTLEWEDGSTITKKLSEKPDYNSPERVRYLPQDFFENLTNEIEEREFPKTLENIVFSYLPDEQKLSKSSFQELIDYKKQSIQNDINQIINEIDVLNKQIIELEKKQHPTYLRELENKLSLKKEELKEHEKNKPKEVKNPKDDEKLSKEQRELFEKLEALNKELDNIETEIKEKQKELEVLTLKQEELSQLLKNIKLEKQRIEKFKQDNKATFEKFGLDIDSIINFNINTKNIEKKIKEFKKQIEDIQAVLLINENIEKVEEEKRKDLTENSLMVKKEKIKSKIEKIKKELTEPEKKYQKYLETLKKWNQKRNEILGDETKPNTIKWLEKQINFVNLKLNNRLKQLRDERINKTLEIYNKKEELVKIYKKFKEAIDKEILSHTEVLEDYEIIIEAALNIRNEFVDKFLSFINQKLRGSFYGKEEGEILLRELVENVDVNSEEDFRSFLEKIIYILEVDHREAFKEKTDEEKRRYIFEQVKELEDFYHYLFSLEYVEPTYELKLGSKSISQLSPGEKGALLIVFYLMLDKDNIPLIVDQPEENLDNESIYRILTKFIKLAKQRRQIILVTHNPNLAIVGDAEQIIFVNIDKKNGNKFSFKSGSIENPVINKHASDILEGTLKAFDLRRLKYFKGK